MKPKRVPVATRGGALAIALMAALGVGCLHVPATIKAEFQPQPAPVNHFAGGGVARVPEARP